MQLPDLNSSKFKVGCNFETIEDLRLVKCHFSRSLIGLAALASNRDRCFIRHPLLSTNGSFETPFGFLFDVYSSKDSKQLGYLNRPGCEIYLQNIKTTTWGFCSILVNNRILGFYSSFFVYTKKLLFDFMGVLQVGQNVVNFIDIAQATGWRQAR